MGSRDVSSIVEAAYGLDSPQSAWLRSARADCQGVAGGGAVRMRLPAECAT